MNVREFERHAQLMLSKNAFDYYASGANDMVTLRENRSVPAHDLRVDFYTAVHGRESVTLHSYYSSIDTTALFRLPT